MKLENPFHKDSQNYRLLEMLIAGPVFNVEISKKIGSINHTRRISDIRRKIRPLGLDVVAEKIQRGLYLYRLMENRV